MQGPFFSLISEPFLIFSFFPGNPAKAYAPSRIFAVSAGSFPTPRMSAFMMEEMFPVKEARRRMARERWRESC